LDYTVGGIPQGGASSYDEVTMLDTASAVVFVTVGLLLLLLVSVSRYVRWKASRLSEREFHVWFQKAFLGMTQRVTELPDSKPQKRQTSDQAERQAATLERQER